MLDRLIYDFQGELARLKEVANQGFILGFGIHRMGADHMHDEFSPEWSSRYEEKDYMLGDPVVLWMMKNEGVKRWSEIRGHDMFNVMADARCHGLAYGAVFSCKTGLKRSFMSVARNDRELTNGELATLDARFRVWCDMVINNRLSITEREKDVLRRFQSGLDHASTAASLDISISTVRQRQTTAMLKLGAKNQTNAVSIAQKLGLI